MSDQPENLHPQADRQQHRSLAAFTRRVMIVIALICLVYFAWAIRSVFLLLFAGIVMARVTTGFSDLVCTYTPLGRKSSLWAVVLFFVLLVAGGCLLAGPMIFREVRDLSEAIPQIRHQLDQHPWGKVVLEQIQANGINLSGSTLFSQITGVASTLFNIVTSLVILIFLTLFLAANPRWYLNGLIDSFPKHRRGRVHEVLHVAGEALWRWLVAQGIAMLVIGILTTIGLFIIGMEFAIVLGLLAGIFQLVPFVGPILWAVPATLLGLADGPDMAFKILILYIIVQTVEGNAITPIVQHRMASVPPVVILLTTVALGLFLGPLGLIVATPLTVVAMVFYQMLYRNDMLGDNVSASGGD